MAFKWQRWYIRLGTILCHELVNVLPRKDRFALPGDQGRAWGVHPFALLPAFGGKTVETAAEQPGYCTPQYVKKEKCAHFGVPLMTSDYDVSLTVPGVQNEGVGPGAPKQLTQVADDALV